MTDLINKITKSIYWDLKSIVAIGFTLLLVVMLILAAVGLTSMANNNSRLEQTINEQNFKLSVVTSMRNIARERSLNLFMAISYDDPFQRDQALSKFRELASDFIALREQFEALNLDEEEKARFAEMQRSVRTASASQNQVATLIGNDNIAEAQKTMLNETIQEQHFVIQAYNKFVDLQTNKAKSAIDVANQANHFTYLIMFLLVIAALITGAFIALFVIRRIASIENALFTEKEFAEVTLHSIADGVITTDKNGEVTYINPVAERLTGWKATNATNQHISAVYNIIDATTRLPIDPSLLLDQLEGPTANLEERTLIRQDGQEFAIEDSSAPIRNKEGETIGAVLVFNDVSEARNLTQQLSWQASHDPLTGLANRLEFERVLSILLDQAKNNNRRHVLLFLDLDKFKLINDTCGHIAGDECLRQLSRMLESRIRENDTLARLGGDEFGILLASCQLDHALTIAENIRQLIASFKFIWEGKIFDVGVSIGAVPFGSESENSVDIMTSADTACYKAKSEGRNQIQVFQPEHLADNTNGEKLSIKKITQALNANRFQLYYQKIIATDRKLQPHSHYEILLRMINEDGQIVAPGAFIPAAERYHLMPNIDRWVVQAMFEWLADHAAEISEHSIFSINLSGQSLGDKRFLGFVIDQLKQISIPRGTIGFEITETSAIANLSNAVRFISTLKGLGCKFSLDDFGSGMSSYSYLKNLDVDFLKIDGAFIKNITHDMVDLAMVDSINRIGHVMGIKTVAEFVENNAIFDELESIGVDFAQGYGIHIPEPLANFNLTH
ncbi:EAL domain-containing protein [Sulfurirhabdus autotrophica]|uniref:PAS domain S-box-containing protein/diguanylate cyclase (GGDEF)-like protein n=1 Tax=Sulfurirhabdus autotrophica TaxID=1706046 RepID=A0A4R3Y187_9PROT|nr:EAL domain-containing protein [Sulfurirhabdus autotrophica]TCV85875.1 PAS domain S-box-containing protein/diguanylate cyclase (GGDEF)-like protein [Sulfurirhabdus autotrophica]